jgi:chaperonin GroES
MEELYMKLRPLADNILLKAAEAEETTASGIILATTNKESSGIYDVVAAGPGTKDVPVTVKVGDKVVVGKYTGSEFKLDGEDYKFVKQDEILAIVTE